MNMGHLGSRGGGRVSTSWGRLTCDRDTRARATFILRQVLRDNRSLLRGYWRVSNRGGLSGFRDFRAYRGILSRGAKISLISFAASQQTTLLVEVPVTSNHRLAILDLTI